MHEGQIDGLAGSVETFHAKRQPRLNSDHHHGQNCRSQVDVDHDGSRVHTYCTHQRRIGYAYCTVHVLIPAAARLSSTYSVRCATS